jgi:hypothetical protein
MLTRHHAASRKLLQQESRNNDIQNMAIKPIPILLFIGKCSRGIVVLLTPRLVVALGVPLDDWIVALGGWLSINLNREAALWLAAFVVAAILYVGSVLLSKDHDWRPNVPHA